MKDKYSLTILFWSISFIAYSWLHEAGHFAVLLLSGISTDQMEIAWAKVPIIPVSINVSGVEVPQIVYFAGGFMAGLSFLLLSFVFRRIYKKKMQEEFWWLFAISLGFVGAGFTEFVVEGFFTKYHGVVLEQIFVYVITFIIPSLLIAWHYRSRILDWYKTR
ncbi:hypothetical protein ACFLTT_01330 [Chloroflexota bacterium]